MLLEIEGLGMSLHKYATLLWTYWKNELFFITRYTIVGEREVFGNDIKSCLVVCRHLLWNKLIFKTKWVRFRSFPFIIAVLDSAAVGKAKVLQQNDGCGATYRACVVKCRVDHQHLAARLVAYWLQCKCFPFCFCLRSPTGGTAQPSCLRVEI